METGPRKGWTAEEKVRIVVEGLPGDRAISEVCRKYGVTTTFFYTWRDKLLSNGAKVFEHGNQKPSQWEQNLEAELAGPIVDLTGPPPWPVLEEVRLLAGESLGLLLRQSAEDSPWPISCNRP